MNPINPNNANSGPARGQTLDLSPRAYNRRGRRRREIFSFAVDYDILELLYKISDEKDITISHIGREAVHEWLRKRDYLPQLSTNPNHINPVNIQVDQHRRAEVLLQRAEALLRAAPPPSAGSNASFGTGEEPNSPKETTKEIGARIDLANRLGVDPDEETAQEMGARIAQTQAQFNQEVEGRRVFRYREPLNQAKPKNLSKSPQTAEQIVGEKLGISDQPSGTLEELEKEFGDSLPKEPEDN